MQPNQSLQRTRGVFHEPCIGKPRAIRVCASEPWRYVSRTAVWVLTVSLFLLSNAQATSVCARTADETESASAIFLNSGIWRDNELEFSWLLPQMAAGDSATFRVNLFFPDESGEDREFAITPVIDCSDGCRARMTTDIGSHRPTVAYEARIYTGEGRCALIYLVKGEIPGEGQT